MKRRNFLKTLLAAPAIPLVGKAVAEAEPVPPHLPCPVHTIDALTEVPRLEGSNYPELPHEELMEALHIDPITVEGPFATTASSFTYTVTNVSEGDGTCVIEMGHRFQAMVDHD